ncbi:diacylglycerol/lipid kinase family protein [Bacteroidota bacterium]
MKQPWLFIVNPAAGNGKGEKVWKSLFSELTKAGIQPVVWYSKYDGHIPILAEKAINEGFRNIATYGGDGTLNACVNGIMHQTICVTSDVLLAHYPAGTGNDWCRMFNVPKIPEAWVEMLKANLRFKHDVGIIDLTKAGKEARHYFINIAGVAYESQCATWIEDAKRKPKLLKGKWFYDFLVLKGLFGFKAPELRFSYNGIEREEKLFNMSIGICRYNAGGMMPTPYADPADGLLDVTTFKDMSVVRILLDFTKMRKGSIFTNPKVAGFRTESLVVNRTDKPDFVEADGEFVGYTPATFSVKKQALQFVIGKEPEPKTFPL